MLNQYSAARVRPSFRRSPKRKLCDNMSKKNVCYVWFINVLLTIYSICVMALMIKAIIEFILYIYIP
jgi:hypothetical protein